MIPFPCRWEGRRMDVSVLTILHETYNVLYNMLMLDCRGI